MKYFLGCALINHNFELYLQHSMYSGFGITA